MKIQLFAALLLTAAVACNAPKTEPATPADAPEAPAAPAHDYGVKASYSTDFSISDPKYGDLVIKLWKDFDDNTLDNSASNLADSVMNMFPGYHAMLSRDSMLAMAKAERSAYDSMHTSIDAIVPLKASGKNETVVAIWGEEHAYAKGKKTRRDLHEVWGINENGKVTWMKQYTHAVPK